MGYFAGAVDECGLAERSSGRANITNNIVLGVRTEADFYKKRDLLIGEANVKDNLMLMDQQLFLTDSHMVKMDRAGMSVSLEVRNPILYPDVIEFAWKIPLKYKYKDGIKKNILKKVAYDYIPQDLLDMPKQGFMIPINDWIKNGELYNWANDILDTSKLKNEGIFDVNIVDKMKKVYFSKKNNMFQRQIWSLLMFEQWYERHIKT